MLISNRDYELIMLSDGTAGFSTEKKDAAVKLIWPLFANNICTVDEWSKSMGQREKL